MKTMRLLSVLLFALFAFVSQPSLAVDKPQRSLGPNRIPPFPAIPEIVPYQTLASWPAPVRNHYIRQLRALLVDVSEVSKKNDFDVFSEASVNKSEIMKLLEIAFPSAYAAPGDPPMGACHEHSDKAVWADKDYGNVLCTRADGSSYQVKANDGVFAEIPGTSKPAPTNSVANTAPGTAPAAAAAQPEAPKSAAGIETDVCLEPWKDGLKWKGDVDGCKKFPDAKDFKKAVAGGQCFNAGNVLTFTKANPPKCPKPTEVCQDTGVPPESGKHCSGKTWSCGGQTICSPGIFGLDENKKPFCVPPGRGATKACFNKVYTWEEKHNGTNTLENMPEKARDHGYTVVTKAIGTICDFAAAAKDITKGNCTACEALRERLPAMQARAQDAVNKKFDRRMFQDEQTAFKGDVNSTPICPRSPEAPKPEQDIRPVTHDKPHQFGMNN